jgi:osmoprotectant transport system permease protein
MNFDYLIEHWRRVLDLAGDHLMLSAIALAVGLAVALPLGVAAAAAPRVSPLIFGTIGTLYTIPSLALLAALIPWLGLGRQPAIVVLACYAQLALVRNIAAALRGVDPGILEAAAGIGMTPSQVLLRVRAPLALPVALAGVRIAAVTTISLATITAWIGAGGLGTLMFDGISRDYPPMILAGAVAIAVLAGSIELLLRAFERAIPGHRARAQRDRA